jgi:TRAP-type C4-dicarboxylate transport system permease small subunit
MKTSAMFWVGTTTIVLLIVTIMAAMNFPFNWVFYITVLGQVMIVYMVYRVLTDSYTTNKTFKDFYEDFPIKE